MKTAVILFIFLFLFTLVTVSPLFAANEADDILKINAAWSAYQDQIIYDVLQARLTADPDDLIALNLFVSYYTFVESNPQEAKKYSDRYFDQVQSYGNDQITAFVKTCIKDDIDTAAANGSPITFTVQDRQNLRSYYGTDFPWSIQSYGIWDTLMTKAGGAL